MRGETMPQHVWSHQFCQVRARRCCFRRLLH
jgi:hypothetical protein